MVYNGVHPFLAETTAQLPREWSDTLDGLESLEPRAVVAGHKVPDRSDDPPSIAEIGQYLHAFVRRDGVTDTPRTLFDAMMALDPDRANTGTLWEGATTAKAQPGTSREAPSGFR